MWIIFFFHLYSQFCVCHLANSSIDLIILSSDAVPCPREYRWPLCFTANIGDGVIRTLKGRRRFQDEGDAIKSIHHGRASRVTCLITRGAIQRGGNGGTLRAAGG